MMCLKIDMKEIYDWVDWMFLKNLSGKWDLVRSCMYNVLFQDYAFYSKDRWKKTEVITLGRGFSEG